MAEAKQCDDWNHTASMLAMLVNTAFGKKGQPVTGAKFHPFAKDKPKKRLSREESRRLLNQMVGIKEDGRKRSSIEGRSSDD
jgi:hypothetical protein